MRRAWWVPLPPASVVGQWLLPSWVVRCAVSSCHQYTARLLRYSGTLLGVRACCSRDCTTCTFWTWRAGALHFERTTCTSSILDVLSTRRLPSRQLLCVLAQLSGGRGQWSAPTSPGKFFPSNTSSFSRCRFPPGSQLAQYPYMAQSLERQLATLRGASLGVSAPARLSTHWYRRIEVPRPQCASSA